MRFGYLLRRLMHLTGGCFALWTIGCSGSAKGTDSTLPPPSPTIFTLTVNSTTPASGVTVGVSPADNSGNSSGSTSFTRTYNSGASVTLTAPATSGANMFSSWTGCTSTAGTACTVTMSGNTAVTANYTTAPSITFTLSVNSTNPASGVAIEVSPADNTGSASADTSFTRTYNSGTSVTLTAPTTSGANTFSSWTGCASTVGPACTVAMNADTTVTANYAIPSPTTYTLTVNSTNPASGVAIGVSPADNNGSASGSTSFARTYNNGTSVTLTAPATSATNAFAGWSGCNSTSQLSCTVSVTTNTTATVNYLGNAVTSVAVTPDSGSVVIGTTVQFAATVNGVGSFSTAVTWSVTGPTGYTGSVGSITPAGVYTTPYPAPASVMITAASVTTPARSASVTLALAPPATASGPALTVDAGTPTHPISSEIYGMNAYVLDSTTVKDANPSIIRWGGDNTTRYNYVANTSNSASDFFFESFTGAGGQWPTGNFKDLVTSASTVKAEVAGNAPVIGWITNSSTSSSACSFQKITYPNQQSYNGVCGNGIDSDGTNLVGNSTIAAITSTPEPPPAPPAAGTPVGSSWVGDWVSSLVTQFGPGNPTTGSGGTGVAHWDLDNEPEFWSAVHRDVHPVPMTYDEVTNGGIGTALAIKTADPTALVSGPVISNWYNYFYSTQDVDGGFGTGPCFKSWSNPVDRQAHGGIPFIEYYLQQMQQAQTKYGIRLLDYVDIHTYFAAYYNGSATGLTSAGDTAEQIIRLNSTRVFWDPTYTDPNYTQPNYPTDSNYTTSCNPPALAPQLIPMLQSWVAKDYPGTKTSIDEYNFGGMESVNGALAEADILGIFGKYGLDKGILWPTTNYSAQVPGTMAFEIYRNYDGADSGFGNMALTSTSGDQSQISVYGAQRTSDGAVTIVVINKTYGALTSALTLPNLTPTGQAQVFLYSNANPAGIVAQPAQTLTPPAGGATANTLTMAYPAQSVTLLVIPTT